MAFDADRGVFPEMSGLEDEVDPNIVAWPGLPEGSKVTDTKGYGASYRTRTVRIDTKQADGSGKSYFLKVSDGEKSMMLGEFESMKAIETFAPKFVPHPIAWGTFQKDPSNHFFLMDFREMDQEVPEMEGLCLKLAEMHKNSHAAGIQQFGFHVVTHNGSVPQDNNWSNSWEEFYARGLKHMLALEEKTQDPPSEEMKAVIEPLFQKVIPRLLRPMETEGRHITPSLVHGDFWHGNTSTDVHTNEPLIFDACSFWGHNEWTGASDDLRTMAQRTRYKFTTAWQKEYLKHYPASAPSEDFDARSALYILRSDLQDSALFPANPKFRQLFIQVAKQLVEAYPDGYEGYLDAKGHAHVGKSFQVTQNKAIKSLGSPKKGLKELYRGLQEAHGANEG
ncbi:MAG: hypothetical protein Q9195_003277 [Heterodermia aff. obscurata]